MLAAKLILALIIIAVMMLGISGFASNLNQFGWTALSLTLFIFISSICKLLRANSVKTIYLCLTLVASYLVFCSVYCWVSPVYAIYDKFYKVVYGENYSSSIGWVGMFFWIGFILVTTAELYVKPEIKLSIFWKVYAFLALVNILSIISFGLSTASTTKFYTV